MSIRLMSLVFGLKEPTGAARLVLLALADNANDEGVCWPSVETIARKAGIGVRWTQRIIRDLVESEYMALSIRPVDGKKNETNIYTLNIQKLNDEQIKEGGVQTTHRVAYTPPSGWPTDHPEGGVETTERVAYRPPESSLEPSIEPSIEHPVVVNAPAAKIAKISRLYEREIGPLTAFIRDELEDAARDMPEEWFETAFRSAAAQNKRSWAYVKGILRNIRAHGIDAPKPDRSRGKKSLKEHNDEVIQQILNGGVKP